jgi:transketolase
MCYFVLEMIEKNLKNRVLELSYKYKLPHLGSCLTVIDILLYIHKNKNANDLITLSCGHAGLALYTYLEYFENKDAEELFLKHGVHPNRDIENNIMCSSGSLGHVLPITIGMALANPLQFYHCIISDGECAEGSIWESLNIFNELKIENLNIHVNLNGWAAYKQLDTLKLKNMISAHCSNVADQVIYHFTSVEQYIFLKKNAAHYHVMSKEDYESTFR